MTILSSSLLLAMTSAEAILTVLNSASAVSPRRFEKAREMVLQEAKRGQPVQQFLVGVTTDDKDLAKRMLDASRAKIKELAERKNNPLAWYLLSMESNNHEYLRRAADGGNVQAMNALGTIAISRVCGDQSLSTNRVSSIMAIGLGYFKKAAAARDPNGFINLGTCYRRGFACERDMPMAFECFKSAAELGHPEGMDYMSACYELGHGVLPDADKSLYWKMRARAARDDAAADRWLRERK